MVVVDEKNIVDLNRGKLVILHRPATAPPRTREYPFYKATILNHD